MVCVVKSVILSLNIFPDANGFFNVSCKTIPWYFFFTLRSPAWFTQTILKFIHCESQTSHIHVAIFLKRVQGYNSNTFTFQYMTYIHTYNLLKHKIRTESKTHKPYWKRIHLFIDTHLVLSKVISFKTIIF